jgi:hypothetical protein
MAAKTTLDIDERLLERARTSARDLSLALPTVRGTAAPRVDVADRDALHDLLDAAR